MKTIKRAFSVIIFIFMIGLAKESQAQGCVANFTYSLGANGMVTFTSTSVNTSSVTNYNWNFGPASYSAVGLAGVTTAFTYSTNGSYVVILNISSATPSCASTIGFTISITNAGNPCIINANFTSSSGANGLVNFNNMSTGTVVGTTYSWNYGDGATSINFSSPHTYSANGSYVVTLTANNNFSTSCVSTNTAIVVVNSICNLVANFTYTLGSNGLVNFSSTSVGTNSTTSYVWNFGNGQFSSGLNLTNVSQTYTANGTYVVTLLDSIAFSFPACMSQNSQTIAISNIPNPCNLSANFSSSGSNGAFNFTNTSTGMSAGVSYFWNFGDGATSSNTSPSHSYSLAGSYNVTLVANNNYTYSCVSTKTSIVAVGFCSLVAYFTSTPVSNGQVSFNNGSTGIIGGTTYTWNFGDGSTSSVFSPSHTYTSGGAYVVSLLANNNGSLVACSNSYTNVVTVSVCSLAANFSHTVGANGFVNYSSNSTGTTGAGTYYWNFGDGFTGTGISPSHTYLTGGAYNVFFNVNDTTMFGFCHDSIVQSINITSLPCNANANFSLNPTNTPQYWTATPSYPWNVTNAVWNWGDGSSSTGLYTSHNYSVAATYTVCLTVTVSCGSTSSTCVSQYISKSANVESMNMISLNVVAPALIPTSIKSMAANEVVYTIYPNPTNSDFTINMNGLATNNVKITLFNVIGKLVYETEAETNSGELTKEIAAYQLSNGVYFIKVNADNIEYTKKVVINK